jgi:molecular chaperone DnaK
VTAPARAADTMAGVNPETGASSQRRSWSRVPLRAKVRMEFADQRYFLSEWAVNLSPGGMFVRSESPVTAGQRFAFEAALTPKGPRFSGLAEVLWVRREWDRAARPPGFAVQFIELQDVGRQAITRLAEVFLEHGVAAMQEELQRQAEEWQLRRMDEDSTDELPAEPPLADTQAALPHGLDLVSDDADTAELPPPDVTGLLTLPPAVAAGTAGQPGAAVPPPESRPQPPVGSANPDAETPPQGLTPAAALEPDDPIERTAVFPDPTATPPARRRGGAGALVAALVAVLAGGGAWLAWRQAQETPEARAARSARVAGDAALVPPVVAGPMPAAARPAEPAPQGLDTVREVTWEPAAEGLWVTLALEGELAPGAYRRHRLPPEGEEPAREVVQLFGARRGYHEPVVAVDQPLLSKIRFGYHALGSGNELRVVLVLPSADVQVARLEQTPGALRVLLVPGRGEAAAAGGAPQAAAGASPAAPGG